MEAHYHLIKQQYLNSKGDSTELFKTILGVAQEIGLDQALEHLQQCVLEKRSAWLDQHLEEFHRTGDLLWDTYLLFYEDYLGVSAPEDGEIVEKTEQRIVMRWWNGCPTLAACQQLGLDTREVCLKAYHQPVQTFLSALNPKLRFDRNYDAIRPYRTYCEEIISLEELVDKEKNRSISLLCSPIEENKMAYRYNPNYVRRDTLLKIDRNYWEGDDWDDIASFDCIPVEVVEILIEEGFLNPDGKQNRSPSAREFLEFMKAHPGTVAHGYAVSPYRDDYRVTIEGLFVDCDSITGPTYHDFLEFCHDADRLDADGDLYSWVD